MSAQSKLSSFVDGVYRTGGAPFTVLDKFLQTGLAEVEAATPEQVEQAVCVADRAAQSAVPPPARRFEIFSTAAQLLGERKASFVDILTAEAGFTPADAEMEVERGKLTLSLCADETRRIAGEVVPLAASPGQESRIAFTIRAPIGIVCAITPFNSPLNVVLHKIGPALAAGNAVILKPSGFTPITAIRLAELLLDAGLPAGLLSVVHDVDGLAARSLLADQRVGFYTFTGSTRVGRLIQAGAGLRRTQLELGSIASTILCADANLDIALPKVANAAFRKAGQVCTSVQRLYVHASRFTEVLDRLTGLAEAMPAGDPRNAATRVGPLISVAAAERVDSIVQAAAQAGAEIRCGAARNGAVYSPTLLIKTSPGMRALDEEIFGPVVSLIPFEQIEQAIDGANDTPYGLSAGIFTSDIKAAIQATARLRFGSVHINETSSARADAMPFGGVKDSGFGHEGPRYAVREYTEERLITLTP